MRELTVSEMNEVDGGIFPAIVAGFMAYNYVVAVYSATQIAGAVGVAVGAVATTRALTN